MTLKKIAKNSIQAVGLVSGGVILSVLSVSAYAKLADVSYHQGRSDHISPNPTYHFSQAPTTTSFYETHRNTQIAAWSLRQIHQSLPLIDDPWVVQVLTQTAGELNATVRTTPLYALPVILDHNINAFAVPGGLIGIHTGTILAAEGLDEIASVLAHEIAHISQRHYEHRLDNNKQLRALQLGGLLATIAASATGDGNAALAMMAGTQAVGAESVASHSREHEREADRVGMQILTQAGYDAQAMPRFFGKLQRQLNINQAKNAFTPSFMQSHPFTAERMSEAVTRARSHTRPTQVTMQAQSEVFDQLYWRVKYLSKQTSETELIANAKHSDGARLALMMHLADRGRDADAMDMAKQLQIDSHTPVVCLTVAHSHSSAKRYDDAQQVLAGCQAIYPERRDLRLALAQAHIHLQQPTQALALMTPLTKEGSHDLMAWQLAYHAYEQLAWQATEDRAKDIATIHVLKSRSQLELWRGQYVAALQSVAQAQQLAKSQNIKNLITMLEKDQAAIQIAQSFKP